jgi:acetyl-CoA acetyltransferase
MAYIVAVGAIPFHKYPQKSFSDLVCDTLNSVQNDITEHKTILSKDTEEIFFGNCAMDRFGQSNIRGQVALQKSVDEGLLPQGIPITNIEAGCATGGVTLVQAWRSIKSGSCEVALAIGVEKLHFKDDPKMLKSLPIFTSGIDQTDKEKWMNYYHEQAKNHQVTFQPHPYRIIFLDIHAMQAEKMISENIFDQNTIAQIAAKNHNNGKENPNAQYRFGATVEGVLKDRPIIHPFTRSMCSPVSDGGSAVLLCSEKYKEQLSEELQNRCIRIDSIGVAGGRYRDMNDANVTKRAAQKCFAKSSYKREHIDIAEIHDSTAFCEAKAILDIGLANKNTLQQDVQNGRFLPSGSLPINTSGGLIAKGHPLGATGIGMVVELSQQLRGESKGVQLESEPKVALFQNAGGMIGLDEAVSVVGILERIGG